MNKKHSTKQRVFSMKTGLRNKKKKDNFEKTYHAFALHVLVQQALEAKRNFA